jgi:hypothetical protein
MENSWARVGRAMVIAERFKRSRKTAEQLGGGLVIVS